MNKDYLLKKRHVMVPAVYLFMRNDQGKILGILRKNTGWMDGCWNMPSGHVEEEELPLKGMVREAKEEIGVDIKEEDLKLIYVMVRSKANATGERVDFYFKTDKFEGEIINYEPEKHEKVEWVDLDDKNIKWIPSQKFAIEQILKGVNYSEYRRSNMEEKI